MTNIITSSNNHQMTTRSKNIRVNRSDYIPITTSNDLFSRTNTTPSSTKVLSPSIYAQLNRSPLTNTTPSSKNVIIPSIYTQINGVYNSLPLRPTHVNITGLPPQPIIPIGTRLNIRFNFSDEINGITSKKFYSGTITDCYRFNRLNPSHDDHIDYIYRVYYDDGDKRLVTLSNKHWSFLYTTPSDIAFSNQEQNTSSVLTNNTLDTETPSRYHLRPRKK